jgi:hypothetical protein
LKLRHDPALNIAGDAVRLALVLRNLRKNAIFDAVDGAENDERYADRAERSGGDKEHADAWLAPSYFDLTGLTAA